jgi:hypothetical protein
MPTGSGFHRVVLNRNNPWNESLILRYEATYNRSSLIGAIYATFFYNTAMAEQDIAQIHDTQVCASRRTAFNTTVIDERQTDL